MNADDVSFGSPWRRLAPWLVIGLVTGVLTALTTVQALERYRELNSGWSWDLAYYNQWFWALTQGDRVITVRPISAYADEGPSVWKMNYLAPIRFALVPIYVLWPDPQMLLIIQNVMFWWVVPAAFMLVRSETRSDLVALSAALLVPLTPLFWPLVANDFRELQLAIPFVLWAIQGYRSRHRGLLAIGIIGMLACRQEFGLVVMSLALLKPREPDGDIGRSYHWAQAVILIGFCWFMLGFFGYLKWMVGSTAPKWYVRQFTGPKAAWHETVETSLDLLWVGLGSWAVLALAAPRFALIAVPWVYSIANGQWALRYLATEQWHHVRYTVPVVATGLAAGLMGYAVLGGWLRRRGRWGRVGLAGLWVATALGLGLAWHQMHERFRQAPRWIEPDEAAAIWSWIDQVAPDDGVLAVYEVTAPLSSRRLLYSYIMEVNKPRGFPYDLQPEIRWVFLRQGNLPPDVFTEQGFEWVHDGPAIWIFRRPSSKSDKIEGSARTFPGGPASIR